MRDAEIIANLERVLQGCGDEDHEPLDENGGDQRDTGELYLKPVLIELRKRFASNPKASGEQLYRLLSSSEKPNPDTDYYTAQHAPVVFRPVHASVPSVEGAAVITPTKDFMESLTPSVGSGCVICEEPITAYDSYGVSAKHGYRYHWHCIRREAATVSSVGSGEQLYRICNDLDPRTKPKTAVHISAWMVPVPASEDTKRLDWFEKQIPSVKHRIANCLAMSFREAIDAAMSREKA